MKKFKVVSRETIEYVYELDLDMNDSKSLHEQINEKNDAEMVEGFIGSNVISVTIESIHPIIERI